MSTVKNNVNIANDIKALSSLRKDLNRYLGTDVDMGILESAGGSAMPVQLFDYISSIGYSSSRDVNSILSKRGIRYILMGSDDLTTYLVESVDKL